MHVHILHLLLFFFFYFSFHFSSSSNAFFSLSVDKPHDIITSPDSTFSAVGDNAFVFAVWYSQSPSAVVWTANRDNPVNGKLSSVTLLPSGNLILSDAGDSSAVVWSTDTATSHPTQLFLTNTGNLVLSDDDDVVLWQSFDYPTDTLLPGQKLTRYTQLVSSRSDTNHSSGFYKLFFDDDNVLRLLYDGPDVSSVYWPDPWLGSFQAGRTTYNSSRIATLDSIGVFNSSDNFHFKTSDYGIIIQRRLKIDSDGNFRVYSRRKNEPWYVSWQAKYDGCTIHGICGANSTCKYDVKKGRKCSCLPGFKVKNTSDWSYGCDRKIKLSCEKYKIEYFKLSDVELYGYDYEYRVNITYDDCEALCSKDCECKAFQFTFQSETGLFRCFTKRVLLNGRHSPAFPGTTYLKVPRNNSSFEEDEVQNENGRVCKVTLERDYAKRHESSLVKFFLWLSVAIGVFEVLCFLLIPCLLFLIRSKRRYDSNRSGYKSLFASGFRKFTYSELKQATKGFKEEIGRGAGGIVYKGKLSDGRIAAIKRLNDQNIVTKQGEEEFLAEVSIIGRLNHMNLIQMWGYCAEGKQRLLVYEYMENGSLADNLKSNTLDLSKKYNIALGTARGLAYLHEECLEWILHCDIKPQNILVDSEYQPKIADFGLSKLVKRENELENGGKFSMIRGTRGYMAPEWVLNLPITSKVDVYSYGIVVLEMITGRSPMVIGSNGGGDDDGEEEEEEQNIGGIVKWMREKRRERRGIEKSSTCEEGRIEIDESDNWKMEALGRVGLECVEEDKEVRPTMSQVVEMLQNHGNEEDS